MIQHMSHQPVLFYLQPENEYYFKTHISSTNQVISIKIQKNVVRKITKIIFARNHPRHTEVIFEVGAGYTPCVIRINNVNLWLE